MTTGQDAIPMRTPHPWHRWRVPMAILAMVALLAAACGNDDDDGGDASPTDPDGTPTETGGDDGSDAPSTSDDPVIVALATELATMDGQAVSDGTHLLLFANVYEGLVGRAPNGELYPLLSTSWEAVDDVTWRFELREGVQFHNGEPFDAEAAVYSINRITDPDYLTEATSYIGGIESAEVVDDMTIEITTDGLLPTLPMQLVNVFMVAPGADNLDEEPVGTGPYRMDDWERGRQITSVVFEDYWGDTPQVQEFILRTIPDAQSALAALQAGEIDIVLDIFPEQADLVPKVATTEGMRFSNIQLNVIGRPELEDPRVRIAMQHAIDKQLMADALFGGFARPTQGHQHMKEGMLGFNPDVGPYEYDPDLSRELLAEAGYEDGFSITLNGAIGRYLKGAESVEFIADQWGDIGLDVDVRLWEWNTYRDVGRISGDEPGALDTRFNWNRNDWFDGGRWIQHVICGGSSSKYCNEEVTDAWESALETTDPEEREAHYQRGVAALQEDPSHIMLLQHDVIHATSERIEWEPRTEEWLIMSEIQVN